MKMKEELPCKTCITYPCCINKFKSEIVYKYDEIISCSFILHNILMSMIGMSNKCGILMEWIAIPYIQPSFIYVERTLDLSEIAYRSTYDTDYICKIYEIFVCINTNQLTFLEYYFPKFHEVIRKITDDELILYNDLEKTYDNICY